MNRKSEPKSEAKPFSIFITGYATAPQRSGSRASVNFSRIHVLGKMPHKTRPMTAILLLLGVNAVLVQTIGPVYDFVCFLPYWERRRERRRLEREAASTKDMGSSAPGT